MEQMWGSIEQYNPVVWHWPIAVYLFLAGLSAGAIVSAIIVKWLKGNDKSPWDGIIKAGVIIAPLTIGLGLLLLIVDLTRPLDFWKLLIHYNFSSVMTIGVLFLFVYMPMTMLYLISIFKDDLIKTPLKFLEPIANFVIKKSLIFESIILILAVAVGAYTGFLLSAMNSYPLFNTPVLPALFLASGISAGISANLVVSLLFFTKQTQSKNVSYLHGLDIKVICAELFFLFILFVGMFYQGGASAIIASNALSEGGLSKLLWLGVVGIGLLVPLTLNFALPNGVKHSNTYVIFNATLVLIGVLALRYYILYAGQAFAG